MKPIIIRMIKKSILLLSIVIMFGNVFASYYADVSINVSEDGLVEIEGTSNHPLIHEGIYDSLTSKNEGYWLLDISSEEIFQEYNYEINLPRNATINYLGTYQVNSFEYDDGLKVTGTVKDKPFKISVQYQTKLINEEYLYMIISILCIIILLGAMYFYYYKAKQKSLYPKNSFSEREFMIITRLIENHGCLTQAKLEKMTKLPKASLHRNIASLEKKGVILKHKAGMSNKITLIKNNKS